MRRFRELLGLELEEIGRFRQQFLFNRGGSNFLSQNAGMIVDATEHDIPGWISGKTVEKINHPKSVLQRQIRNPVMNLCVGIGGPRFALERLGKLGEDHDYNLDIPLRRDLAHVTERVDHALPFLLTWSVQIDIVVSPAQINFFPVPSNLVNPGAGQFKDAKVLPPRAIGKIGVDGLDRINLRIVEHVAEYYNVRVEIHDPISEHQSLIVGRVSEYAEVQYLKFASRRD